MFALEIWDEDCKLVTFYTVVKDGAELSETDKVYKKYLNHKVYGADMQALNSLILEVIGDIHGAKDVFFNRTENAATALPFKGTIREVSFNYPYFPIRLYCLKLTESVVVLFNGGLKLTTGTAQENKDVSTKMYEAHNFATRILKALNEKEILLDETTRKIICPEGNEEILLY